MARVKTLPVTHSCGHLETVLIQGNAGERDRRVAFLQEKGLCSECYRAKKAEESADLNARNAARAAEAGVPPISEGSEKQIPWAESIRTKFAREAQVEAGKLILALVRGVESEEGIRFYYANSEAELFDLSKLAIAADWMEQQGAADADLPERLFKARRFHELATGAFRKTSARFWIDNQQLMYDLRTRLREDWSRAQSGQQKGN